MLNQTNLLSQQIKNWITVISLAAESCYFSTDTSGTCDNGDSFYHVITTFYISYGINIELRNVSLKTLNI